MDRTFSVRLGTAARARIERDGIRAQDIACVPAAAGGPKGLALIPLDRWLFGEWFPHANHHPALMGASIGAWRMAAAAQLDPLSALNELSRTYIEDQVYGKDPSTTEVARLIRKLARSSFGGTRWRPQPQSSLRVLTARANGVLRQSASRRAFARAALDNTIGRGRLALHLRRVVFGSGPDSQVDAMLDGPGGGFDRFGHESVVLSDVNAEEALLASGSIPLLCEPVKANGPEMPPGWYWDGGLIDYHLYYPYHQLDGLVLYPHFIDHLIPGWLDKFLPWRKQGAGRQANPWLSNVILVSPSPAFLHSLPNRKLPDRSDFYRYGLDHPGRIRDWKRAVSECGRFAEDVAGWLQAPDVSIAQPL